MASLLELGREYETDRIPLPSLATIGQRDQLIPPPYDPKNYSRGAWRGLKDIGNTMIVEPGWELGGALQNIAEGQGMFGDYANAGMGVAGAVPAGAAAKGLGLAGGLAGKISPAIFAGIMAKTADRAALAQAERLAAKGAPKEQIWNETGWFKGGDDKWRFEIPDNNAHASARGRDVIQRGEDQPIAGALWHTPLYEAYPELRNVVVQGERGKDYGGISRGGRIGINADVPGTSFERPTRSILLHEAQHEVQRPEGFMVGRGPEHVGDIKALEKDWNYFNDAHTILNEAKQIAHLKEISDLAKLPREQFNEVFSQANQAFRDAFGRPAETGGALQQVRHGADRADSIKWVQESYDALTNRITEFPHRKKAAFDDYWKQASEVEARNVQKRMDMTPEQRKAAPPWTTEDVPRDQQIVRMESGGRAMSTEDPAMSKFLKASDDWEKAKKDYMAGKIDDDAFDTAEAAFKKINSGFTMIQKKR